MGTVTVLSKHQQYFRIHSAMLFCSVLVGKNHFQKCCCDVKIQMFSAGIPVILQGPSLMKAGPSPGRGKSLKGVWSENQFSKEQKTVGYWLIQPVGITKHQQGEGGFNTSECDTQQVNKGTQTPEKAD